MAIRYLLTAALLMATALSATSRADEWKPCPPQASELLNNFYSWLDANPDTARTRFSSRKDDFTPDLFDQLRRSFALTPDGGRFLDFDPFTDSQSGSFGHKVEGCRTDAPQRVTALVSVRVGLNPERTFRKPINYLLTKVDQRWRIADITYEDNQRLQTILRELLTNNGRY